MNKGVGTGLAILQRNASPNNRGVSFHVQTVVFILFSILNLTTSLNQEEPKQSTLIENCNEFRISQIYENCDGGISSNSSELMLCNVFKKSAPIVCSSKFSPFGTSQQPIEEFCSENRTSKVLDCQQISNCKDFQFVDTNVLQNNATDCKHVCANREGKTRDICWFLVNAFNKMFQDVVKTTSPAETVVNPKPAMIETPEDKDNLPTTNLKTENTADNTKLDDESKEIKSTVASIIPKEETKTTENVDQSRDADVSNTDSQAVKNDKENENNDISNTKQENEENNVEDEYADNDILDKESNDLVNENVNANKNDDQDNTANAKVDSIFPTNHDDAQDTMNSGPYIEDGSSFLPHFIFFTVICITAYLVYHNKSKILALVLEGRRGQNARRRSGGRTYTKLDSTLEENMDLKRETSLRQVIY